MSPPREIVAALRERPHRARELHELGIPDVTHWLGKLCRDGAVCLDRRGWRLTYTPQ